MDSLFLIGQEGSRALERPRNAGMSGGNPRDDYSTLTPRRPLSHIPSGSGEDMKSCERSGRSPMRKTRGLDNWRRSQVLRSLPITSASPSRISATYSSPRASGSSGLARSLPKPPGLLRLRKCLFKENGQASRIIFMNLHNRVENSNPASSMRLPRGTWVGLRCPWVPSACPVCRKMINSLSGAMNHFKRLHAALKVLYI